MAFFSIIYLPLLSKVRYIFTRNSFVQFCEVRYEIGYIYFTIEFIKRSHQRKVFESS